MLFAVLHKGVTEDQIFVSVECASLHQIIKNFFLEVATLQNIPCRAYISANDSLKAVFFRMPSLGPHSPFTLLCIGKVSLTSVGI